MTPPLNQDIRVALVEDQSGLRESLEKTLSSAQGIVLVGAFSDAEQALREIPEKKPQVVTVQHNARGQVTSLRTTDGQ